MFFFVCVMFRFFQMTLRKCQPSVLGLLLLPVLQFSTFKVGYLQLRGSCNVFHAGHFLLLMPLTCWPSALRDERLYHCPAEDYGKMWRHYKISTSRQMRVRLKQVVVVVKGDGWHCLRATFLFVCFIDTFMSDISFFNCSWKRKNMAYPFV